MDMEFKNIVEQEFEIPCLNRIRDTLVFCYYTRLSFFNVEKLNADDTIKDIKGKI
jgi:hypothetical protein